MLSDEEKKNILFQIDMQLYDEFNDKFCEMNDNLGTIYTYKDIDDLEKLEKETEIKLLRKAIEKQSKEIEELKEKDTANLAYYDQIYQNGIYTGQRAVEDKIKAKIEEVKDGTFDAKIVLQSLLEKE